MVDKHAKLKWIFYNKGYYDESGAARVRGVEKVGTQTKLAHRHFWH